MRPTLTYIKEKFEYFNLFCFEGSLPLPPIRLNLRYGQMGITRYRGIKMPDGKRHNFDFSIEISIRRDLPEEEYIDTLVHEMIHYYIAYNDIIDDSPHGTVFKQKMKYIVDNLGIRVTLAFDPSEEYLVTSITRIRYVCVAEFEDGKMGLAVVAKNKIFDLWQIMSQFRGIKDMKWYASNRAIFEKYPVMVSPGLIIEDSDKLHHYLTGALELELLDSEIRVRQM